ncbi:MAG: hypothetical protein HQL31_13795, partial [Planctomycetes bacterium]|nr:hypothetical protein [Planctomycetota bacterium]
PLEQRSSAPLRLYFENGESADLSLGAREILLGGEPLAQITLGADLETLRLVGADDLILLVYEGGIAGSLRHDRGGLRAYEFGCKDQTPSFFLRSWQFVEGAIWYAGWGPMPIDAYQPAAGQPWD